MYNSETFSSFCSIELISFFRLLISILGSSLEKFSTYLLLIFIFDNSLITNSSNISFLKRPDSVHLLDKSLLYLSLH